MATTISPVGAPTTTSIGRVRGRSGFSVPAGEARAAGQAAATGSIAPAGLGVLALQDQDSPAERDRRARRRADQLLEELRGLQLELLGGSPDPDRLARLEALEQGEAGADPALREALQAILLRARVEVARRERRTFATG